MVELELTADEVKALSAALNLGVKTWGICAETMKALAVHQKLEAAIKVANETVSEADVARPN